MSKASKILSKIREEVDTETLSNIHNSFIDGQFKQMVRQMDDLGMKHFAQLMDYVSFDLDASNEALALFRRYFIMKAG